ncbi:hypothetical protein MAPG_06157 [Magnaporthiopsis poae ATCC 64411]|uniref:Uncharacterized protein n=1 Tax=Magnaporthiopsis poae (strain ATCC 64411 / 73-15) TaxID=644358 RepID=A0A0C4E1A3_MAGP6|nr:hypothetical protein MAPG_06157 [Magnaporthiopsis poae ATCC 64411]
MSIGDRPPHTRTRQHQATPGPDSNPQDNGRGVQSMKTSHPELVGRLYSACSWTTAKPTLALSVLIDYALAEMGPAFAV